ncbi:hypothetical protein SAMN05421855_10881 [Ulvibacter litoralis]|uniref:DUF1516 family protein n=1 Tax=Ulvibacter litoralis TaxID=227084 RepID=A0A1G7J5D6_9FLAO|nr:hypothetical protein SAMN05421855_10881 [Ulvibacter litoralis]
MIVFNLLLLTHFIAFLLFLAQLVVLFPKREKQLHKTTIFVGITIVTTGVLLQWMYTPMSFQKIVVKSILFVIISILCGLYSGKTLPNKVYYSFISLTVLASIIAVLHI